MKTSETIFIEGIQVNAPIGLYDWEQVILRKLIIDVEMKLHYYPNRDNLEHSVDYEKATLLIQTCVLNSKVKLIEELGGILSKLLLDNFKAIKKLYISIKKPGALKGASCVGYSIKVEND